MHSPFAGRLLFKVILPFFICGIICIAPVQAANALSIQIGDSGQSLSTGLQILVLMTVLSVAPSILLMTTSFIRFIVVFGMLRLALGLGQLPPTQVLIGLALILTFMVMKPTFTEINDTALQPFLAQEIDEKQFFKRTMGPLKDFMLTQTSDEQLKLSFKIANLEQVDSTDDLPTHVLMVAYMLGELKKAFQIGFTLFLPFVVIDMIAASALVSIGLMFLPPATIALPFKVVLFILVDGWNLITENLVSSFTNTQ
jgi:flagellar biosynthetic protein FliP